MTPTYPQPSRAPALRISARTLIAAFALCVIAAVWGNVAVHVAKEREQEIARAYRQNAALARSFEEHVRRALKTADNALWFLKIEYEKRGQDPGSTRRGRGALGERRL